MTTKAWPNRRGTEPATARIRGTRRLNAQHDRHALIAVRPNSPGRTEWPDRVGSNDPEALGIGANDGIVASPV
jgi:hypothetical protein